MPPLFTAIRSSVLTVSNSMLDCTQIILKSISLLTPADAVKLLKSLILLMQSRYDNALRGVVLSIVSACVLSYFETEASYLAFPFGLCRGCRCCSTSQLHHFYTYILTKMLHFCIWYRNITCSQKFSHLFVHSNNQLFCPFSWFYFVFGR